MPHPKTDVSKNQNCIAANNSMARVYKTFFFPKIKIDIPTILGFKEPPSFRNKIAEMCCLYRRTGRGRRWITVRRPVYLKYVPRREHATILFLVSTHSESNGEG